jgi:uncharacterized protein involved in oxidation of intracellular sulfur
MTGGPGASQKKSAAHAEKGMDMKLLMIIASDDGETIYNAMRLANVAHQQGDEVGVFMLGKGVTFEQSGSETFNVMGEIDKFEGDFYV